MQNNLEVFGSWALVLMLQSSMHCHWHAGIYSSNMLLTRTELLLSAQCSFELSPPCAGFSARQRKLELERLNEQLRKINLNLRQQARAGTVYAPGLMYAPTPMPNISIGSEDDGGNLGGAATLVGPRPEAPEDSQVPFTCLMTKSYQIMRTDC